MNLRFSTALLTALLATGCAPTQPQPVEAAQPWPEPDRSCASDSVLLDAYFDTGNLGRCTVNADGSFTLTLLPEDPPPINPSAWFAFRASGAPGETVAVRLEAESGYARYWPKTSIDGRNWTPLPRDQVNPHDKRSRWMTFQFELDGAYRWVAGQEIIDTWDYQHWIGDLGARDGIETSLLGRSVEGRPVYLVETPAREEFVLLLGRQHPPEVTGAIAMRSFVETVLADTELATRFRERFQLGIVPLMNPDGVAGGHWRHNAGGKDMNRDWGPFEQPETRAVMRWVEARESTGNKLRLVVDFHSTFEDLFYTPPIETDPLDFSSLWLTSARLRLDDFPFRHVPSTDLEQANSKNYFYRSRGIPAVTYEAGDATDRAALRRAAVVFAEEMMQTLLDL